MKSAHTSKIDFMSNIPEELLLCIMRLSSMKARAAVQTCVLSKRWTHVWEFLPDLDFDLREFNAGDSEQDEQRFSRFVTTMLERRKTDTLDKFRLSCQNLCQKQHCSSIENWILYAIQHQVRVVELEVCRWSFKTVLTQNNIPFDSVEELHLRLCECPSLDREFILTREIIGMNQRIIFPRLLKLQLYGRWVSICNFFTKLISRCPLLEDLWLESFDLPSFSDICSEKLQHLTVKNCQNASVLTIKAPILLSLRFFGHIYDLIPLAKQCGSISSLTIGGGYVDSRIYILSSLNIILNHLPRVENLELCASQITPGTPNPQLSSDYQTFHGLKMLSFCWHTFNIFPCIRKCFPNLEKIILWPSSCQHSHDHYHESPRWDVLQGTLFDCQNLKVVEVVSDVLDEQKGQLEKICIDVEMFRLSYLTEASNCSEESE